MDNKWLKYEIFIIYIYNTAPYFYQLQANYEPIKYAVKYLIFFKSLIDSKHYKLIHLFNSMCFINKNYNCDFHI